VIRHLTPEEHDEMNRLLALGLSTSAVQRRLRNRFNRWGSRRPDPEARRGVWWR
jgi:hypothetical protein